MIDALAGREGKIGGLATLLKVFLPYLVWNTVFDNSRVVSEMGEKPARFSEYCLPLLQFSARASFHLISIAIGRATAGDGRAARRREATPGWPP